MSGSGFKKCRMCGGLIPSGGQCDCVKRDAAAPMSGIAVSRGVRLSCRMLPDREARTLHVTGQGMLQVEPPGEAGHVTSVPVTIGGRQRRAWIYVAVCDEEPDVVARTEPPEE